MFGLKRTWIAPLAVGAIFLLGGAKCDGPETRRVDEVGSQCVTNQVQIAVFDGFLQNLCGCAESTGKDQFIFPPATLTCTFAKGATVFIQYRGATKRHQIAPTGTPAFPTSLVYDPENKGSTGTFAFLVSEAGNYAFQDEYNTPVRGMLVAQ